MVYTDKTHLIADTLEELHSFAANIGMKAEWFQNHKRHPHYDIWGAMLKNALNSGAVVISSKDLVQKANKLNCSLSTVIQRSEQSFCHNCHTFHCNTDYAGYCCQSCYDGIEAK